MEIQLLKEQEIFPSVEVLKCALDSVIGRVGNTANTRRICIVVRVEKYCHLSKMLNANCHICLRKV